MKLKTRNAADVQLTVGYLSSLYTITRLQVPCRYYPRRNTVAIALLSYVDDGRGKPPVLLASLLHWCFHIAKNDQGYEMITALALTEQISPLNRGKARLLSCFGNMQRTG